MYKVRAKSHIVLGLLSLLSLLALIIVENNKVMVKADWYEEKLEAAQLSQRAAEHIKHFRLEKGVFIDNINDPNQTALIGQEFTLITTDRGYSDSKLSSTNPNFAAVVVELAKEAGLKENDYVAVAFSGSFPALNISTIAALETLKINPVIITSVGSSNYGANDPYFTWLDIENELNKAGIFKTRSIAASIGGGHDVGRGLSPEGRNLIKAAISRNNLEFINEDHLEKSIDRRMELYNEAVKGKPIKAFVNVGGGIASLGNTINGNLIEPGLTELLPRRNYPVKGVIIQMGEKGIPIIHMLNISKLLKNFKLPNSPVPLPEPGDGGIFIEEKYSMVATSIATFVLIVVIVLVYLAERRHHQLGSDVVPNIVKKEVQQEKPEDIPVV